MGILESIVTKFRAMRQRSADKKEFIRLLIDATKDGMLTHDEMNMLTQRLRDLGLSAEDIKRARVTAYTEAHDTIKSDRRITKEEEAELANIQRFLQLSDHEIGHTRQEFQRLRIITEIEQGNLPTIEVRGVVTKKGETIHWSEDGSLIEERVISRRYEGGSHGVSLRIMKGVSYRVGAHRGQLVSESANVPVSTGELLITNTRIIFRGDRKSFNLKIDKILDFELFANGIRITGDTGKPRLVKFSKQGNADIIGALVSRVVDQYAA